MHSGFLEQEVGRKKSRKLHVHSVFGINREQSGRLS
jgi:hypothetical protein